MANNGRKRGPKVKQGFIEGMEPESIREIDDAAENYEEVVQERTKLSKEEDEKKDALIDVMTEHKLDRYESPSGLVVTVTNKKNIKVKHKKDAEEGGDDE